jgi:hypothetical protein
MPRTRSALAFLDAAVVLTLALPSLVMTPPASAARERRYALPDQWTEVAAGSDSPEPASDDDKKRVPNTPASDDEKERVPKTPTGEKERAGDQKKDKDDKDDEGDDSGCCYGDDAEDDATSEPSVQGPPEWVEGSLAIVVSPDSSGVALMWSDPGGEGAGAELVADLPEGSDVVVHDSRVLEDGLWLQVSVADAQAPMGWMRAEDLVARRSELPSMPPRPPFGFVVDISWFRVGPEDVNGEYDGGGWRTAMQGFRRVGRSGRAVLSAGFSWAKGEPKFNYVTPTQIDYPQSSLLQIIDLGLSTGLDLQLGGRSDFRFDIGPMLCWTRESARMDYDSLQGGVVVGSGHREESLEEWRMGGQFNMGFGFRLHANTRIRLLIRAFAISWKSESQKSLTLDFIGTRPLIGGGIGISLGY